MAKEEIDVPPLEPNKPGFLSPDQLLRLAWDELRSLKKTLDHQKNLLDISEARLRLIPKEDRGAHMFTFHPKCPRCEEKCAFHIGFRGKVIGRVFGANDELRLSELVLNQEDVEAKRTKFEIPDHLPENFK